jgi:hypothetical protein
MAQILTYILWFASRSIFIQSSLQILRSHPILASNGRGIMILLNPKLIKFLYRDFSIIRFFLWLWSPKFLRTRIFVCVVWKWLMSSFFDLEWSSQNPRQQNLSCIKAYNGNNRGHNTSAARSYEFKCKIVKLRLWAIF